LTLLVHPVGARIARTFDTRCAGASL
jgi:hypothetical protein